jgi:membrane protein implicated in regulation of membrane protease activity
MDDGPVRTPGTQYVGRVFTLETPIANGVGKLTVTDTTWKIRGPDTAAGTYVRVTAVEGTSLMGGAGRHATGSGIGARRVSLSSAPF